MNIRVLIAAAACATLMGCASSQVSQLAPRIASANTAGSSQRVYKQTYTPRTTSPQPRRQPTWPAGAYRAPAVTPYAATPSARPAARRVATLAPAASNAFGAGTYGRLPAPPPPRLGGMNPVATPFATRGATPVAIHTAPVAPTARFAAGSLLPPAAASVATSVPAGRSLAPVIRPARRAPVVPFVNQPTPLAVSKPLAPVRTGSLFKRSGSYQPTARTGGLSRLLNPRGTASGRDCKT